MKQKQYHFKAELYKTGINFCVDVPAEITASLVAVKGYIRVKGTINGFPFIKFLVPVKNGPYRLFVNMVTLKGAKTNVGKTAEFVIEQDEENLEKDYPTPMLLAKLLEEKNLTANFNALAYSRRKDILRYLNNIKTTGTLQKNVHKVIAQLEGQTANEGVPISIRL